MHFRQLKLADYILEVQRIAPYNNHHTEIRYISGTEDYILSNIIPSPAKRKRQS